MNRLDIIDRIGRERLTSNAENGEFSYPKALRNKGLKISDYKKEDRRYGEQVDLRFEGERLVVIVETKARFTERETSRGRNQLKDYSFFEKKLSGKRVVALLVETQGSGVMTWLNKSLIIRPECMDTVHTDILSFDEYDDLCFGIVNNRLMVVDATKQLNEILHSNNINEHLRSQFVGTCLLTLKNGLAYKGLKSQPSPDDGRMMSETEVLLRSMREILAGLLAKSPSGRISPDDRNLFKLEKLGILNRHVLEDQDIVSLPYEDFISMLEFIEDRILPYINDRNTAGQDLLNLFFTTFNKYVGKSDKNQAFTPDHICDFMSKVAGVNKNSVIIDPCCGSGAFLVRAMTDAMDDCDTAEEREAVKRDQIFGIEREEGAYGLASTNMLIHGDGNSNVIFASMFEKERWIKRTGANIVLMNPPYNATKNQCLQSYVRKWSDSKKQDPSKGFHYVKWIADILAPNCKMAVLLPMQCAISTKGEIMRFKREMLRRYTLDAVFSLPNEIFYPGANAVACCMVFDLSISHKKAGRETFFGYFKDDGFIKRKGIGRVDKEDYSGLSVWTSIEEKWLDLYRNRKVQLGYSVMKAVTADDEWLAEAYMDTPYERLKRSDFQATVNDFLSYLVKEGRFYV